ncbi:claudin domain-containing protein 2 [Octodon degus]|uniref:Claudin domain-containing protein 2 n=1 Tax=Octodon degus TaxID=10160 RepID=A0A6P3FDU0_OCTDE|nr:claudin domain-containing protein 2 [Octodon degus]
MGPRVLENSKGGGVRGHRRSASPASAVPSSSLPRMGVKRSLQGWGTLLSFMACVVTILSTVTNYWILHENGHSGLWQECTQGLCSNIPRQPTILIASLFLVLSASCGVVATVMGLRVLYRADESLRGQTTSVLLFVSGLLLLMALTSYTVGSARKDDVFSWSYFSGWLALPFSVLAGSCFLLADMILRSTEAIRTFPVCL